MWKYIDHDEAFGLPPGTIRAAVFLLITLTVCALSVYKQEIPQLLGVAFGTIIGFYFGKNTNSGGGNGQVPPQNQVQPIV